MGSVSLVRPVNNERADVIDQTQSRFDALLHAMAHGQPPSSARKKPSTDQASHGDVSACSSDTQILPDTSADASR